MQTTLFLAYFCDGHVSNDVIILETVKPQMGWEWLTWAKYKVPVILCLYSIYPWPEWWHFLFSWQVIKIQNLSRDLFYSLSLKHNITLDHSDQNHIRGKKTTAIAFQFISVIWHLATWPISWTLEAISELRSSCFKLWPSLKAFWWITEKFSLFSDFMQIRLWAMP